MCMIKMCSETRDKRRISKLKAGYWMISIFQLLSFLHLKVINNNKIHVSLLPVKFALKLYNRFKGLLLTFAMGRITISDIYWNTGTWFFGLETCWNMNFVEMNLGTINLIIYKFLKKELIFFKLNWLSVLKFLACPMFLQLILVTLIHVLIYLFAALFWKQYLE